MKKFLFPLALFVAFSFASCDKDSSDSDEDEVKKEEKADDSLLGDCERADAVESCDLSNAQVCSDENTEEVYYSYNGKRYNDVNDLIDKLCPNASVMDKTTIHTQLSAQGRQLVARIRSGVL